MMHSITYPYGTPLQYSPELFLTLNKVPIISRIFICLGFELIFEAVLDGNKSTKLPVIFDEDDPGTNLAEEFHDGLER